MVSNRGFDTLREATEFAIKQPIESIIEIKHYDSKVSDTKNNSNNVS